MRKYGKVSPKVWTGKLGDLMRGYPEMQAVVFYLLTNPHANLVGIYRLPIPYLEADTGVSIGKAAAIFKVLSECGFMSYDADTSTVWIRDHARHELGGKVSPQQAVSVGLILEDFRASYLVRDFAELYPHYLPESFDLDTLSIPYGIATPSPSPSPSPEPSPEPEHEGISGPTDPHPPASGRARPEDIDRVLDSHDFGQRTWIDYQVAQGHKRRFSPVARSDGKQGAANRKLVAGLLRDHDVETLCLAARNVILIPHSQGRNDRGREYMALSVALNERLAERAGIWDGPDEELAAELRRSIARAEHAERKRNGKGGIVASTDPDAYSGPGAALLFPVLSPEAAATIAWSREQDRIEGRDPDAFH